MNQVSSEIQSIQVQSPSGPECPSIQAVILSGGKASRAGGINKSFMVVEGRRILDHQLERLRPVFGTRIAVVTNRLEDYADSGLQLLPDIGIDTTRMEKTSLHGMASIMLAFPHRWCFTLPCDMPFPDMRILREEVAALRQAMEVGRIRGLCVRDDKHLRPYHSLLHGSLGADAWRAFIESQGSEEVSTRDWLESRVDVAVVHHRDLGVTEDAFRRCITNFNRLPGEKKNKDKRG